MGCFDTIKEAYNFGPSSERILCQIKIERIKLFVWGKYVGLLNDENLSDYHKGLDIPKVWYIVFHTLRSLKETLKNCERFREQYGEPYPPDKIASVGKKKQWAMNRLKQLRELLEDLKDFNNTLHEVLPTNKLTVRSRDE
ncbi:hypothetical protein RUND412_011398, partial [Rhizina undulata]